MPDTSLQIKTHRQQGSVYILVLGASLLVAAIGVSSLLANRVQRKTIATFSDRTQSRELARTAIDRGLWEIRNNSSVWRTTFSTGGIANVSLGGGTFTLAAVDPVDGDLLNNSTDPVILVGMGKKGDARYLLRVTLDGDGTVRAGTWSRVVQ